MAIALMARIRAVIAQAIAACGLFLSNSSLHLISTHGSFYSPFIGLVILSRCLNVPRCSTSPSAGTTPKSVRSYR
ncbi:hypothetical protein BV22DRAFT_1031602 [Leucogyrophana mollusca]|uniref:Uncharacterized protein n=1 Tax=Leucogyrophana mollusca TaxID=85980 RepID=A0ACB8BQC1_9AGAM|nr:hypothetical protein BV22DRAFT_1031602 [Leucogyrophana mollusca]